MGLVWSGFGQGLVRVWCWFGRVLVRVLVWLASWWVGSGFWFWFGPDFNEGFLGHSKSYLVWGLVKKVQKNLLIMFFGKLLVKLQNKGKLNEKEQRVEKWSPKKEEKVSIAMEKILVGWKERILKEKRKMIFIAFYF